MISFIIPVYNKGSVLFITLNALIRQLPLAHLNNYEIIVVNDGSTDNSLTEALRFKKFLLSSKKIRIYHYNRNVGKGYALRFGFHQSKGDIIVFLDGDMDIGTGEVLNAIKSFINLKPDMVMGSKYHPDSRVFYPFNRYIYSLVLRTIIRILFNLQISDTQVGLKIFKRKTLTELFPRILIKRFAIDLEMLVVAQMLGVKNIVEVPVHIRHTSANQSSVDWSAVGHFCIDVLAIYYRRYLIHYYDRKMSTTQAAALEIEVA